MIGKRELKVILIGAGGMGSRWFNVLKNIKRVKIVGVVDADIAKARVISSQAKGCSAESNYKKAITSWACDAVVVVVPHIFLAGISKFALLKGRHVLCEKPGAVSVKELKAVMFLAQRKGLCYMVGFNHRFHDGFLRAKKILDSGKIGQPLFIRSRYGFGGRAGYDKEWRLNKKISGGGELIDQGVHMIDAAMWFLGDIAEVKGFIGNLFWKKGSVEDNAFVLLKTKKGQVASIHTSWANWKPIHSFEIYGDKGYVVVEGLGKKYGGDEKIIVGVRSADLALPPQEKILLCDSDADNSLKREFYEFMSAITQKRNPIPNGADAVAALKIVEKIYHDEQKK